MKFRIICLVLPFLPGLIGIRGAGQYSVTSPDRRIIVEVSDEGGLSYQVSVNEREILARSKLGLEFEGGIVLGANAKLSNGQRSSHNGKWENRFGKRRTVRDHYHELRLTLKEPGKNPRVFGLVVRAYDNGVAFCYDLPEEWGLRHFVLNRELTEFTFADMAGSHPRLAHTNTFPVAARNSLGDVRHSASRQKWVPTADNFIPAQTKLRPLQDQQVIVRNLFIAEGNFP